ncbi:phosphotransferase [Caldalkalibacillus salinus]|uniref:phosphotransferase n=1 Tax=Caldalkalibacillus salinus TaxID=2803787 RepID=UPI0019242408|nr:phosphotransferase [Caldalkalibacillus salinus]
MKLLEKEWTSQEIEASVLREYDFIPQQIENVGRIKKVTCSRGEFALKKSQASPDQLKYIDEQIQNLEALRYDNILSWCHTKYGERYVHIDNEAYYVTPWVEDHIEEKYKDNWEQDILNSLGTLHKLTTSTNGERESIFHEALLKRWRTRLLQMVEYKNFAEDRSVLSPVETAYITHFDYLQELALRAIRYLQEWDDKNRENRTLPTVLCHGHVHRKHVLQTNRGSVIISFDHAQIDTPAREIAAFFRRHADKVFEREGLATLWLEAYEKQYPLDTESKALLAIYLLFPERVFKEIDNYYQAVREWPIEKQARYVQKQMQHTMHMRSFVRDIMA